MERFLETLVTFVGDLVQSVRSIQNGLTEHYFTRTRFSSVVVKVDNLQGVPVGMGKCKAIKIRPNQFVINSNNLQAVTVQDRLYYGDSKQQTFEYPLTVGADRLAGANPFASELIYCQDLSEVYLRVPATDGGIAELEVQIMIFD